MMKMMKEIIMMKMKEMMKMKMMMEIIMMKMKEMIVI